MKKMKQWLLCLLFAPVIFTSCQKSIPAQANAIPKDAKFVFAMNNEQLIKKGGFDRLSDFKFYQYLQEMFKTAENGDFWMSVMNDPKKSGLNIDQAYVFMEMQGENICVVLATAMKDQSVFEENLAKLHISELSAIQDKQSYKMLVTDENATLTWNDKLFFVFAGDFAGIDFERYFKLPAEESLLSQTDFKDFCNHACDLGLWMPMQTYADISDRFLAETPAIMNDMAGMNVHAYLNFNNDEITVNAAMTPKEKVDAYYEKYPIIKWESDKKMLSDFPETSYLAAKIAIDFPQYLKFLTQIFSEMSNVNSEMAEFSAIMADSTVNTVLNALGGEAILSLYGFAEGPMPMPLLGLSFSVKSEADFQQLVAMLPADMVRNNGATYAVPLGFSSLHFAYKDNRVFVTDDEKGLENFMGSGNAKNISSNASIGKPIASSPSLFYINLNLDDYPKALKDMMGSFGFANAQAMSALSLFKDFSVYMNSKYDVQASLKFKSGKENSLKQLMTLMDSMN